MDSVVATQAGGDALDERHDPAAVLRRRIAVRRPAAAPPPAPPAQRSPDRAAAVAVARAADRAMGLALTFDSIALRDMTLAEVIETLPERALLSLVEGPQDLLGVVALGSGFLGALIEMQATGRVSARGDDGRMPTRTDGAFSADFVNMMLAELAAELTPLPGQPALMGYRYASFLPDSRPLDLLLDEGPFRLIELRVRAGQGGQRGGSLHIILPLVAGAFAAAPGDLPALDRLASAPPEAPPETGFLTGAVHQVELPLRAVLCRKSLSLGELRALRGGDLLALPRQAGASVTLETETGQPLLRGRLGQAGGHLAVRVSETPTAAAPPDQDRADWADAARAPSPPGFGPMPGLAADPSDAADEIDLTGPDPFRLDPLTEAVPFAMSPAAATPGLSMDDGPAPLAALVVD